jgi:uncharacterized protein
MREGRRGRWATARRALFFFVFLLLTVLPALALNLPALSGRVVDEANILDQTTRTALTQKLEELEAKTTDQLVVVTLKSLQGTSIEDFGVQLGRGWRIGQQDKNNGVLLIVVPSEHKVRIEVGYGLEGTLTDAVSKLIIENAIIPRFRANDIPGGVTRGVDDIISVLTGDAEEWKQRAAKQPDPTPPWGKILILILALGVFWLVFIMIVGAMPSHPNSSPSPQVGQRLVIRLALVVRFLRRLLWRRGLIRRRRLFRRWRIFRRWRLIRRWRRVGKLVRRRE